MTELELILKFAALFILGGFLLFRHRRRVLSDSESRNPAAWQGHGIHTADLQEKLAQMREQHATIKPKPLGSVYHKTLLRVAAHTVARFGYFREREEKKESESVTP